MPLDLPLFFQATKERPQREFLRQAGRLLVQAGLCQDGEEAEALAHLRQRIVQALVEQGPSTVAELSERVPELQIVVPYSEDKPYAGTFSLGSRIVPGMCTLGLLVRGAPRGSRRSNLYAYAPLAAWLPGVDLDAMAPDEAQVRLVRRYLAAFGPATVEDVAWWAGFVKREARRALSALGDEVAEVEVDGLGGGHLMLAADVQRLRAAPPGPGPAVNLLPALDPYIMGYRDRCRFLVPERYDRVFDRAGNAFATAWVDGRVMGVWRQQIDLLI